MITKNPFKPNGVLKKGFSFYNNTIWTKDGAGRMDVPAFKNKKEPWTFSDCPNIGPRLRAIGVTPEQVKERTNLSISSATALLNGNYRVTAKNAEILTEMERG